MIKTFSSFGARALKLLAPLALVLAASSSCTIIASESEEQCQSKDDCAKFGAGFTCGDKKTCIAIGGFCTSNRECLAREADHFCRIDPANPSNNRCQPLFTDACKSANFLGTREDLETDPLILGVIWEGSWGRDLQAGVNGLDFARQDFVSAGGVRINGQQKRVVFVGCDIPINTYDPLLPATEHLTGTIGTPVIFGPLIPSLLSRAVTASKNPDTMFITPDSVTSVGRAMRDGVPIVYAQGAQADESKAVAAFVRVWEDKLKASKSDPVKLALLWEGDDGSTERVKAFEAAAKINGVPVLQAGALYRNFTVGTPAEKFNPQSAAAKAIVALKADRPDIIVTIGGIGSDMLKILEDEGLHPHWVGTGESNDSSLMIRALADKKTGLRQRFTYSYYTDPDLGVRSVWNQRFKQRYPDTPPYELAYATFDSFYLLAFSMSRVQGPLTGVAISKAMQSSFGLEGSSISVEPEQIRNGFDQLTSSATTKLALGGTLTSPVVYSAKGDLVRPKFAMACVVPNSDPSLPGEGQPSQGAVYDVATNTMLGPYSCP